MSCAKGHIDIPVGQLVADEANRGTTIGVLGDLLLLFVQINKNLNKIELFFSLIQEKYILVGMRCETHSDILGVGSVIVLPMDKDFLHGPEQVVEVLQVTIFWLPNVT